ncbi:NAD(P)/FAD-dependent oxidoreductase [Pseudonocardiaceae bacterium YIM PH 21723]|nr:NAD(P)/FAD-dependent oxidoreductase [Pseudonocardiaceae bacterium YIM PH 21723]
MVIIGAGLAGGKAVEQLREQGYTGEITLIGQENHRPYERPPLSKGYLQGKDEKESVFLHPLAWYGEHKVDLRLGNPATAVDPAAHRVTLRDGSTVEYAKLLLATGSAPRQLPGATGVRYLRTVDDSAQLRELLDSARRIVIIGAGWVGLEVAAAARAKDVAVTVIESAELPLLRVLGPEVAQVFADLHTAHGVDFRFGAQASDVDGSGATVDGARIEADAVLVGIGITPNTELAEAAGLTVDNGIVVDAGLRTSDPDIYAAGDVANHAHPVLGKGIRVEHWANALNQPAVAVTGMLGGSGSYERQPYFYTDQYDLGMEYRGYVEPGGYDRVVLRGDVEKREFHAFWLQDNTVLAAMNVNLWDDGDALAALIGKQVDPDRLADTSIPL